MSYDIDMFVNTNKAFVTFEDQSDEELSQANFEKLVNFDKVNTEAYPVLVYEMNTKAVAWYDIEMFMGFAKVD
jgi:hypothetical protein